MIIEEGGLRIAVPSKGRLNEKCLQLLEKSGLRFRVDGRRLFARCADTGTIVIFSNAQDIPGLVAAGVVDLGVTGSDLIVEKQAAVSELLKLGFGRCRLSLATHRDAPYASPADLAGKIVGTKFTNLAARFFNEKGVAGVRVLEIGGAVEVMVLLGLVDAILDVVETGSSLREHDLVERETLLTAEAVLIGNDRPRDAALRDRLVRRLQGVIHASRYSMLEYNCPATRIGEASAITPGFSSPTVQHTGDEAWLAVKVMVEKSGVQAVMDRLEALGCRAIIETEVVHCRL